MYQDLQQATVTSECLHDVILELGQEFLELKQVLDELLIKFVDHIG